jgi:hypothetical protein
MNNSITRFLSASVLWALWPVAADMALGSIQAAEATSPQNDPELLLLPNIPRNASGHHFAPAPSIPRLNHFPLNSPLPKPATTVSSALARPGGGSSDSDPLTTITASWQGLISDSTVEPPDPHGAAGPSGIIQVINTRIAYWNKSGNLIWGPVALDGMFSSVGNNSFSFDPRALYDPASGHFYVLLLEQDTANTNSYLNIAVSKTSDPRSSSSNDWFLYRFRNTAVDSNGNRFWGDYPGLGFDDKAIYTTVNLYDFSDVGLGVSEIGIFDKASLIGGTSNRTFVFTPGNSFEFTLQPCTVRGTNTPGNVAYFAEIVFGSSTLTRIWALSDPLGTPTLSSAMVTVPDNGGFPPGGAPQQGTSFTIDPVPVRTQGNAVWVDGSLWFCNTAGGSAGKSSVYFYEVNANGFPASVPSLGESGFIDGGSGVWTYQPSICCNPLGDICMVYCQSSSSSTPTIMATTRKAGQAAFDPPVVINPALAFILVADGAITLA